MHNNDSRNIEHINNTETNIDHHNDYYNNLHICSMNVQGLKKFENDIVFKNYCKGFDLVGMYETWQRHHNDFVNFIDGYTNFDSMRCYRKQTPRGSGGVTVFVKNWLINKRVIAQIFEEMT